MTGLLLIFLHCLHRNMFIVKTGKGPVPVVVFVTPLTVPSMSDSSSA